MMHALCATHAALRHVNNILHKRLADHRRRLYDASVDEKKSNGFGDLNNESAQRRNAVFLCAYAVACLLRAAVVGIPSGMPVCFRAGSPTLLSAAHPFGDGGRFNRNERGHHA